MPTLDEMYADLEAADAEGDTELVQHIVAQIKLAQGQGPAPGAPAAATPPAAPPGGPGTAAAPAPGIGVATPTPAAPGGPPAGLSMAERYKRAGIDPNEYSPTGTSMENFLAGAGQSAVSTGRGIQQLWNIATRDEEDLARLQQEEAEARRLDAPLLDTGAGRAGQITGHVAQALMPVGAGVKVASTGGRLAANVGLGAAHAATAPTVEGESRAENAMWGGLIGGALPVLPGLIKLASNPKYEAFRMLQKGLEGTPKFEQVQAAAGKKIGKLTEGLDVPIGKFQDELLAIKSKYGGELSPTVNKWLKEFAGPVASKAKPRKGKAPAPPAPRAPLTGVEAQETRTALMREAKKQGGIAQSGIERFYRTLDRATDEAIEAAPKTIKDLLIGSRAKRLRAAREQYRTGVKPEVVRPYGTAAGRGAAEALRRKEK